MSKSRLLIVGSFPDDNNKIIGGIAKSCKLLLKSKEFSEFEIITFDSSQKSNPPPIFLFRLYNALYRLVKFPLVLLKNKPSSVLIFCSAGPSAIEKGVMILIARTLNIPGIIFPRAGKLIHQTKQSKLFLKIIKFLFNKAEYFLCQGKVWHDFAKSNLKFNINKAVIINNWTATEELIEIGDSRLFNQNDKFLKFLFVGWVIEEKGIKQLLESTNNLIKKGYKISVDIIGDGKLMPYCNQYIKDNNLSKFVSFKGWLNSVSVNEHLKNSDVFILPSWHEGMPNSLIEALSAALPCIVTSVGVIPNYLEHNQSALIIKSRNVIALENSMKTMIEDYELRKKLSKNGHLVAKNVFLQNKALKKLSTILNQIGKL